MERCGASAPFQSCATTAKGWRCCHRSSTWLTHSCALSCELSMTTASCAGLRGAALREVSRASRASKSARRSAILAEIPCAINCLCRRSARQAALAVRYTLSGDCGKITVPMSRPSATSPGRQRKPCCSPTRASRTAGRAETRDAFMPASSVRIAWVTSSPASQMLPLANRTDSLRASAAMAASLPGSMASPARSAARAAMR